MNRKLILLRERKAAAQIIGSLMIFLIVTTLCVMVYAWAHSTVDNNQATFNSVFGNKQNAIKECFILEYVLFTDTVDNPSDHKNVTIYVRNVGDIDLTISAVYVNGTLSSAVNPTLPQMLLPDQVNKFSITITSSWDSGSTTHIVVASERGSRIQGYWQAP